MQLLPLLAWALLPGCGAVSAPGTVRGFLGGSLSVTCTYMPGQEKLPKFWCTPSIAITTCISDLVITSESQPEVRRGRFSIRDNRARREFTVTVDPLSKKDEGIFSCGVRTKIYQFDDHADVKVIVLSASSTLPSTTYRTTTTTTFSDLILSAQTVSQGEIVQSTSNPPSPQLNSSASSHMGEVVSACSSDPISFPKTRLNVVEHILTPAIIVILFLLAVAVGVLVILSRKKKAMSKLHPAPSGAAIEMNRTRSMPATGAEGVVYADITHDTGRPENQYSNAEAFRRRETPLVEYIDVRHSVQPLGEEGEALYTRVQKPMRQQEQINAKVPSAPQPSEELYSTVWGT